MRSWIVGIVLVGAMIGVAVWHYTEVKRSSEYDLALASLKKEFLIESGGLRVLDPDTFRRESAVAFTGYFAGLDKLDKENPGHLDIERQRELLDRQAMAGKLAEDQRAIRVERLELALALFKRMRSGSYRPLHSAADDGFRFDILDIAPVRSGGETVLRLSFAHWGIFGPVDYRSIAGNMKAPAEEGKPQTIPQITADGQPPAMHFNPEEAIAEFPPGLEIGYYDLPQLPREAQSMELAFDFFIRSLGGTPVDVHVVFPDIPIADGWKLPEGQAWEAQERVATDDELRGAGIEVPAGSEGK